MNLPHYLDSALYQSFKPLSRLLDLNGDGTGTKNLTGNYNAANDIAYIQPASNRTFFIHSLTIFIEDAAVTAELYGGLAALGNGIELRFVDDDKTIDLLDGVTVKRNSDYLRLSGWKSQEKASGGGNQFFIAEINFPLNFGWPLELNGNRDKNPKIEVGLKDDFTGLVSHYFNVLGYEV